MNFSEINLFNEYTGKYKDAPLGFSWTTLFWGFFPALFRDTYLKFSLKTTIKKNYRKKSTSQKLSTGNRTKLVTSSSSVYEQSLL